MSPQKRLAVCLLASEVAPLSKTGGLADVAGALTKTLSAEGHDVRLFTPAYASVDRTACAARPVPGLQKLRVTVGAQSFGCAVLRGRLPGGAPVFLIDCPALFDRTGIYTADADEHVRFLAFTRAALLGLPRDALGAADRALQRLAHRLRAAVPARPSTPREPLFAGAAHAAYDPQHRLPGDLRRQPGRRPQRSPLHSCRCCTHRDLAAGRINALRHGILYAD